MQEVIRPAQLWTSKQIDKLFPHTCFICKDLSRQDRNICKPCKEELPWIQNACKYCAQSLVNLDDRICGHCLAKPVPFKQAVCVFHYQLPISRLVADLKFKHELNVAHLFSQFLLDKVLKTYLNKPLPDAIIPIPLHRKRLRKRGFNQAIEMAKFLSKGLNIPMLLDPVKRKKNTSPQSTLPINERGKNIRNAFSLEKAIPAKHIAIIDDVYTSGHTAQAMAKTILKQHDIRIDVWTIARTRQKKASSN